MRGKEIKEYFENLVKQRNQKEEQYCIVLNEKGSTVHEFNEKYRKLQQFYLKGKYAQENYEPAKKDFNQYYLLNKKEIEYLLKLEPEFEKIKNLEKLIEEQKEIGETATKSVSKTRKVERRSSPIVVGPIVIPGHISWDFETYEEIVPDKKAREKARNKIKEYTAQLEENKYYSTYKEKYHILSTFYDKKKRLTNMEKHLSEFAYMEEKVNAYVNGYNSLCEYDNRLKTIRAEVDVIEKSINNTKKYLPTPYRKKIEKDFSFVCLNSKDIQVVTKEGVLQDLQSKYEKTKACNKIKEIDNEIELSIEF